jgi:hypothetical protein
MKIDWKFTLCGSLLGVLMSPLAQAQFCGLTNMSLSGAYGYVASEAGTVVATSSGTGTTGTTGTTSPNTFSSTALGQLLGGIAAGNQFALGGVLTFDGAGNVNATSAPGGLAVHVGTYKVNSDCSVVVSLTDPFGTNPAVTQLAGVVLGRGAELDLTSMAALQANAPGNTTNTTTTATAGTSGSGLAIRLVRVLYQNGCSDSNLTGLYGFVLNPTSVQTVASSATTTATPPEPSAVIGYLEFDGTGHIVALSSMSASSTSIDSTFSSLQYTGTYSVNSDCSGTMTINKSSAATATAGDSQGMPLNFVITPPTAPGGGAFAPAPGLDLSFSTADASGSGYALAQ